MKRLSIFLSTTFAVMMFLGLSPELVQAGSCNLPDFASASFSDPLGIDNPYMPWVPRTLFQYRPVPNPDNVVNWVYVNSPNLNDPDTYKQITVGGKSINCLQVHDYVEVDGLLSEDTLDWYAQDDDGNVWYCGEATTVFLPGGETDTSGSFTAGEDVANIGVTALPGIIMPGDPKSGECTQQEFYQGEAEDWGMVMRLNGKVSLQNGDTYEDCLETKEGSTLELGDIEQKLYALRVGLVLNFEHHGKRVRWELISVDSNVDPPPLPPTP
jgi:hypothetical protein